MITEACTRTGLTTASEDAPMPENRDQDDVLSKKDNVTKSDIGLQIWDDDDSFGVASQGGNASQGTAERAARVAEGQKKSGQAK
jgi:hypothetical protein